MSQSAYPSTPKPKPKPKFLLDENVKKRLATLIAAGGFDVKPAPKGFKNGSLAELSKTEKRVLVTNDSDFADSNMFPKDKVFSVVLLRLPQDEPEALLKAFALLLKERSEFEGYLTILEAGGYTSSLISS